MIAALSITCIVFALVGMWHGERMYRLGVKAGREREAMLARHGRERVTDAAKYEMASAEIQRRRDALLIRRWTEQAWKDGR